MSKNKKIKMNYAIQQIEDEVFPKSKKWRKNKVNSPVSERMLGGGRGCKCFCRRFNSLMTNYVKSLKRKFRNRLKQLTFVV